MGFLSRFFGPKQLPAPLAKDPIHADGREMPGHNEARLVKIGLIVGHSKKDPGAVSIGKFSEYAYNAEIARLASIYALGTNKAVVECIYRDGVGIKGAYAAAEQLSCDVVIELHFNAATGQVSGTETLCSFDNNDVEFAHAIHAGVCEVFEREGASRGVKTLPRNARGSFNVYSFPNGVNCLVEPFFGDHPKDSSLGLQKSAAYARGLVDAVILWATKKDLI